MQEDELCLKAILCSPIWLHGFTRTLLRKTLPNKGRIDLIGFGNDQSTPLIIEVKFGASLTPNQPNSYLDWFPDEHDSILLFLVPESRIRELWAELKDRIERVSGALTEVESERRCMRVGNTRRHIMLVSWKSMLNYMATCSRAAGEHPGIEADIRQLIGLANGKNSESQDQSVPLYSVLTANSPIHHNLNLVALTGEVVERGNENGILERRNLRQGKGYGYFARYFYISDFEVESCLVVRSERWKNEGVALSFEFTSTGRGKLGSLGLNVPPKYSDWVGINLEQSVGNDDAMSSVLKQLKEIAEEINGLSKNA